MWVTMYRPIRVTMTLLVGIMLGGCALAEPVASERVTVKDLVATPARFDGRRVSLSGQASAARVFPGLTPTYGFSLDDGTQRVTVIARGAPICPVGGRVTVEGWFRGPTSPEWGHVEAISIVCR
jgi:hypothetical protein